MNKFDSVYLSTLLNLKEDNNPDLNQDAANMIFQILQNPSSIDQNTANKYSAILGMVSAKLNERTPGVPRTPVTVDQIRSILSTINTTPTTTAGTTVTPTTPPAAATQVNTQVNGTNTSTSTLTQPTSTTPQNTQQQNKNQTSTSPTPQNNQK